MFEITDSGINKYTKGDAFDKDRTDQNKKLEKEANVIRPHTDPSGADNSQFWIEYSSIKKFTRCWCTLEVMLIMMPFYILLVILRSFQDQGFVEVFEITRIVVYLNIRKVEMHLSKNDDPRDDEELKKERHVIRPHTHPSKADKSSFGYSIALSKNLLVVACTLRVMLIM